jgi:hypothetical protein
LYRGVQHDVRPNVVKKPGPRYLYERSTKLNRTELAQGFEVSLTTIDNWIRRGMPYLQKGGPGKVWDFDRDAVDEWRSSIVGDAGEVDAERGQVATALGATEVIGFVIWLFQGGHLKVPDLTGAVRLAGEWADIRPRELRKLERTLNEKNKKN